jgi:hypothetical protein
MVIVGEPGDDPLLGATTLEGFGLVLDPFRWELRPTSLPLKRASGSRSTRRPQVTESQEGSPRGRRALNSTVVRACHDRQHAADACAR